jgi:hypothetical protein
MITAVDALSAVSPATAPLDCRIQAAICSYAA